MNIPHSFRTSCTDFEAYPCNLVQRTTYSGALKGYRERLDILAPRLCIKQEANDVYKSNEVHVAFRDFEPVLSSGQVINKQNVVDDFALKNWLGYVSAPTTVTTQIGGPLTKRDPRCRFIFLHGGHSRKPLKITKPMLVRILSYHQVMPSYLDFISVFGAQGEARGLRFNAFREQVSLSNPPRAPQIADLGRSGRQYQLSYNLKGVACISRSGTAESEREWSIRQAAIHHQFDVVYGTTLWIITKGDLEIKDRVQAMTGDGGSPEEKAFGTPEDSFRSSLAAHLLYGQWSLEEWRWYILWLEDTVEQVTQVVLEDDRSQSKTRHHFLPRDLQSVHYYEDKINEASMILEANTEILASISEFYKRLLDNKDFPMKDSCSNDVAGFVTLIGDLANDAKMQISRVKLLSRIVADRKSLMLQHLQSQTTETMEKLTMSMHEIGRLSQKETFAMRIITVVALMYLPATFVSTFFSTDIVKYQNGDPNGIFSLTALLRWIEVTVPLTILTLVIAYLWVRKINYETKLGSTEWYYHDGPASEPTPHVTKTVHSFIEKT